MMAMLGIGGFSFEFSRDYLRAALMVSLLSVWLLVVLFYYLNRYTRREYFTIWTAAWLFYALWLTLSLQWAEETQNTRIDPADILFRLQQSCVAISAVLLLWGSLRFLELPVRQLLMGLFMLFVLVWTWISPYVMVDPLQIQVPVFILLGLGSMFAGISFFRLRRRMPFVGAGMLSLGFLLWGLYLASYPFSRPYKELYGAGFLVAAVLQLFIAVSMIVLVLEEVRYKTEKVLEEIATVRSEKEALESKVITTEEKCQSLYNQVRFRDGIQQAYDQLRETQQIVVQQERLRALGQMASGVAHDINNALSPIVAYAELLQANLPGLPEDSRRHLQNIRQAAEDVARIVARMREFYRRRYDAESLVDVDVNSVIEEVVEMTRPRWRDLSQREGISIHIERDLTPGLPPLRGDPSELREALTNLVFNSVDAMPMGGTLRFATRLADSPDPKADTLPAPRIVIEVGDNGIGMDEDTRQRCLEPFFSTKAKRGGTGLGLAMVYGMVQRHEGHIEVESAPGRGTCIRLLFPIRAASAPVPKVTDAQGNSTSQLRLLCIDDEPKIRELLMDCLTHLNHSVAVAADGKEGVDLFRSAQQQRQPFDVVITDLGMPEVDGHQVARAIKAESPGTPVIMMTGWGSMINADREPMADVDAVIGKPPRLKELNELLIRITAGTRGGVTAAATQPPSVRS